MSGNLMAQEGLVMACSLAMLFLMCWKGVLPYTMLYRMHPSDHTSLRTPTYTNSCETCSRLEFQHPPGNT